MYAFRSFVSELLTTHHLHATIYTQLLKLMCMCSKKMSEKDDKIRALQEENARLTATLSRARIVKEHSDYFKNRESDTAKLYKNLSETAKSVEKNATNVLDAMKTHLNTDLIEISDFNKEVIRALKTQYSV